MRKSGCLRLGIIAIVFIMVAGVCGVTSFSLAQQTVVDLNASGFQVEDPLGTLRCAIAGQCEAQTALAQPGAPLLILTPMVTSRPTDLAPAATLAPTQQIDEPLPTPTVAVATPTPAPTIAVIDELPRITDPRQMHILLLGIDQRSAAEEQGPFRTDTMILLSINPARKTVGVLSLPRDLWVEIPDHGHGRINTANFVGDSVAYPGGGGPALAMETVAQSFGVRVDKYLLVNFNVFTSIVDTLAPNGVLVYVDEYIDDPDYPDDYYGTIHVTFQPGEQRMNAETLLQYARTRATEGGDFDRARRQQVVLDAVRAEVLSAGGIVNFISQAPQLWGELQDNYRTNLNLNDIIALGRLMGEIKREDIRYRVVDNYYATLGLSPQGDQVLYPDYSAIRGLILDTFYPQTQLTHAEIKARADSENALLHVYNGTNIVGLAGAMREWLLAQGVRVDGVGNDVTSWRHQTEIHDYGRHPFTTQYLAHLLGLPEDRIVRGGDGLIASGVLIALGADAEAIIGG